MDYKEVAAMFDEIAYEDALEHHGIKGQRWGVRRFQNTDGSLTAAGKKRRSLGQVIRDRQVAKKRKASLEKARQAKAVKKAEEEERARKLKAGKLKLSEMTDAEIQSKIDRINLEKSYKEALKNERSQTRGKRFVDKLTDATIDKLAEQVGADLIAQTAKSFGAKGINSLINKFMPELQDLEKVYANNKKKS